MTVVLSILDFAFFLPLNKRMIEAGVFCLNHFPIKKGASESLEVETFL